MWYARPRVMLTYEQQRITQENTKSKIFFKIFDRYCCGDPTQISHKQRTFRIVNYRKKVKISCAAVSCG
jgi:hypothetical protein